MRVRCRAGKWIVFLLLGGLPFAACVERDEPVGEPQGQTRTEQQTVVSLAELTAFPQSFAGKEVAVRGRVEPGLAFQFVNEQPYRLVDAGGALWVITEAEMPPAEQEITVRGRVVVPYQIKGRRYEVALIETERLP